MRGTANPGLADSDEENETDEASDIVAELDAAAEDDVDVIEPPAVEAAPGPSFVGVLDQNGTLWTEPLGERADGDGGEVRVRTGAVLPASAAVWLPVTHRHRAAVAPAPGSGSREPPHLQLRRFRRVSEAV